VLSTEHDAELQVVDLAVDLAREALELSQHLALAELLAQLDVLLDVRERGLDPADGLDRAATELQLRDDRARALLVVPELGLVLELLDLREALNTVSVVKDPPSTAPDDASR
jgi:hypothetical protein